jgi:hypothetical protein
VDGLPELVRRVGQLDIELAYPPSEGCPNSDIVHFVRILEQVTSSGVIDAANQRPSVSAADADAVMDGCELLARLNAAAPELVTGPLPVESQYWIATGKPDYVPYGGPTPREAWFVDVSSAVAIESSGKPFGVGLFTSSGMWRTYLDLNRGSTLFPLPWRTWAMGVRPDARVREVTSAAQWVEFVLSNPLRHGDLLYPDWKAVARSYDAVHLTLRAIAAIQGMYLAVNRDTMAPVYWDVESTFWLHWCFESVRLVDTTIQ